jgi:hypothetical protein
MKTVSEESAPAAELEQHLDTPNSMDEAMETGFLPDDEHYRLTGEFKKPASEKPEESAPSKTSEKPDASAAATETDESENDDASAASSSKAAPSESAQTQTQGRESRWQKRERELKEARAKIARLEAEKSQPQARSESAQPSTQTSQAATETKAAPKPKIDDVDEKTGKPKYKSYADYEDAKDQWLRQDTLREFNQSQAKTQQLTAQQQAEREIGQTLTKKFEPLRAKYPDFDKVALNDIDPATGKPKFPDSAVLFIPAKSVTDDFIVRSPHGGEVLYYLGQHPEITQGFYGRNQAGVPINLIHPLDQTRKLMEIEAQFSGTASSGKSGDDKSSSSSAKPVTQASRPPHQVSGTGTVAKDAVEQAVEDGDTETYMRAQNAKELARLKKK